ncbi:MAG: 16S rRNA (guanine(966)-N(2))-methyltransferase RsmD [Vulcanibacillus sp.]
MIFKKVIKLRVIAGSAKGRPLKAVPGKNTRPTTDKIKEAIFNIITPYLQEGLVLDLYAGTGGLGIEALSRGMDKAIFIDQDKISIEIIKKNLILCDFLEISEIYRNDSLRALNALIKRGLQFDLVFIDPPYKINNYDIVLKILYDNKMISRKGIIIVEHDVKISLNDYSDFYTLIKKTSYGNTGISIYQSINRDEGAD